MRIEPRRAITRPPGKTYTKCLSCHPLRDTVNLEKAREQHTRYRETLAELGLEVTVLTPDDMRPDACFVEDNAVVRGGRALICRMGAPSRRGEEGEVERALGELGVDTKRALAPGTIEGGDVVHLEDRLISGVSQRTNLEGVRQMSAWLGVEADTVRDPGIMHLKSHLTYLGSDTVIVSGRFASHDAIRGMQRIVVPEDEEYAADTLAIGKSILMPAGMTRTAALIREAGFDPVPINVGEFEKCDGAVTCLSILF